MATTVITQVIPTGDGMAFNIKGTVGGTAFLYRRNNCKVTVPIKNQTDNKQSFAQEYADAYNAWATANALLASATVTVQGYDQQSHTVAYGGTPVAQVGYNNLEITGTVDGTSTKIHMDIAEYLEYANNSAIAQADFQALIGRRLIVQAKMDVDTDVLTASFTTT